ncbi:MAG: hypothetical protein Fur0010_27590 [Bdellovibrio sp.]
MKAMIELMRKIFTMPFPWNLWVIILSMINFIGGVMFISTFEGKFSLFSMMGAVIVMTIIYARYGFVRLLGLGHILFWLPFVAFCIRQLTNGTTLSATFRVWLLTVIIINSASLIIDFIDLFKFLKGERDEMRTTRK